MTTAAETRAPPFANRLAREKSPYLLQHAHNPVDWNPWGEAAFARARKENKPIFLSIGYSTCHWCHVMERECFEDADVARLLNRDFISIKVDREERPDVDAVYMTYIQAATGSGGWPMSIWLTPSLKPFFGGTYFTPDDVGGRPGFKTLLERIAEAWRSEPGQLENSGEAALAQLQAGAGRSRGGAEIETARLLSSAFERIGDTYDPINGGFGGAPKFPRPAVLHFLFRHLWRTGRKEALAMALHTLRRMADGGIHDRIGGGFHRYATDERWHVPHFEKMLYDQAQLALVAVDALQATRDSAWASLARDILDYVRRDMTGPEGQFYSAEDADSPLPDHPEERAEGRFYVWEAGEIRAALGDRRGAIYSRHFGVKTDGNVRGQGAGEWQGKNVLQVVQTVDETAKAFNVTPDEVRQILEQARFRLFEVRASRPRPNRDDKALTAWNGLMISAFARGAQALGDLAYLEAAQGAASFIRNRLTRGQDQLWRRYREGEAAVEGTCADYAFLIQGLLDLYETTFDTGLLAWALRLQDKQNALFWDTEQGGYFDSIPDPRILLRLKETYDGAEPSANSVSAMNLLRLSHVAPERGLDKRAEALFKAFGQIVRESPDSAPQLLSALGVHDRGVRQVVIAGRKDSSDTQALLVAVRKEFLPDTMVLLADGGAGQAWLAERIPALKGMAMIDGKAAAYVCHRFACQKPTSDSREMVEQLKMPFLAFSKHR